jgi:ankyrin repeat protein
VAPTSPPVRRAVGARDAGGAVLVARSAPPPSPSASVTLLLDKGVVVDTRDKDGFTPLIWAANRGAGKLVELLIARGADVNARTTQKYNAGRAALYLARNLGVVRVLLAAGADPRALTEDGGPTWEQQTPAAAKLLKAAAGK